MPRPELLIRSGARNSTGYCQRTGATHATLSSLRRRHAARRAGSSNRRRAQSIRRNRCVLLGRDALGGADANAIAAAVVRARNLDAVLRERGETNAKGARRRCRRSSIRRIATRDRGRACSASARPPAARCHATNTATTAKARRWRSYCGNRRSRARRGRPAVKARGDRRPAPSFVYRIKYRIRRGAVNL